ncbi:MAG: hypothetical protein J6X43_11305, partial [Bacteroidales bacterium]|nr:hypothetical protein [Bacteroidales bacterium]
ADAEKPHLPSPFIYPLYNRHPERSEGSHSFSMIAEQIKFFKKVTTSASIWHTSLLCLRQKT